MTDAMTKAGGAPGAGPVMVRQAAREDAAAIAGLFLISSDGLAACIWSGMKQPGLSLIEIGPQRYARENVAFSYRNFMMAEAGDAVLMIRQI